MPLPIAFLTKQNTDTSGTGTLTLGVSDARFRTIATATGGVSTAVGYRASLDGSGQWEIGVGVHNGASPGTLTRATVLANNLGTTSPVSFVTGRKDVQIVSFPGQRATFGFTTNTTAALADLGSILNFTGSSSATLALPAAATVPLGAGYLVRNAGSAGAVLTIDGNASELVGPATTLLLFSGESVELFATATGWTTSGLSGVALIATKVPTAAATLDFVLPSASMVYEFVFNSVVLSSAGQLLMRTSTDGGATFAAGAGNYGRSYVIATGASTVTGANDTGTEMILSTSGPSNNVIHGRGDFSPGDGAYGARMTRCITYSIDSGGSLSNSGTFNGNRVATGSVNAIRFLPSSGNFAATGFVSLYARRY